MIPFIPLVIIPSFLFSGILVAVDLLPTWARAISRVSPMYYANQLLQEVVDGTSPAADVAAVWGLPLYGALVLAVAALTLRESR